MTSRAAAACNHTLCKPPSAIYHQRSQLACALLHSTGAAEAELFKMLMRAFKEKIYIYLFYLSIHPFIDIATRRVLCKSGVRIETSFINIQQSSAFICSCCFTVLPFQHSDPARVCRWHAALSSLRTKISVATVAPPSTLPLPQPQRLTTAHILFALQLEMAMTGTTLRA